MARINTNVSSLIAQHNLQKSNSDLQVRMQRLSTGLRINRGADGPADLIVSERLRSEITGIGQAIDNAERATNVIATGEAALAEVSSLLTSIKGLIVEAANEGGLSREEIEANQLQIDSAVASISRIANTTTFAGLRLLDGSLDYITSGMPTSAIAETNVYSANFGNNATLPVSVEVVTSAQKASLLLSTGTATFTSSVTIEIAGNKGVEMLQFVSGTPLTAVMFAINQVSEATGVTASLVSATNPTSGLIFNSNAYGSDNYVSVRKVPGSGGDFFQTYSAKGGSAKSRDTGQDVLALINGNLALGQGTKVKLNTNSLDLDLQLSEAYATQTGVTKSFNITGGGARYQLGPLVESNHQVSFGIGSVAATRLGNAVVGYLNSIVSGGDNALTARKAKEAGAIVEEAITQVSVMRGRLGAFEKNTLQASINSLQIALENVTTSESQIRDADFAAETSAMTRAQILTNVGTTVLSTANQSAQSVLALLQ